MSILIKGMEMPKWCYGDGEKTCPLAFAGCCMVSPNYVKHYEKSRHPDCPLVEVPPHGRLIDADYFLKHFQNGRGGDAWDMKSEYEQMAKVLDRMPSVIEAESFENILTNRNFSAKRLVECDDCKHLTNDRMAPNWQRRCELYGVGKAEDGYCNDGERREDELR
jgi:hypothetical protein